jgi:cadmium resistance protein CadD (predicted permease)
MAFLYLVVSHILCIHFLYLRLQFLFAVKVSQWYLGDCVLCCTDRAVISLMWFWACSFGMGGAMFTTVVTAVMAFAATNFDDILVLMVLFANVNANLRRRHIVAGQYLGFTGLLLLSLPGGVGGWLVPQNWLALLGLLPIGLGLAQLWQKDDDDVQSVNDGVSQNSKWASWGHPATYQVAAVTVANGGDNVGIYVPLFANHATPIRLIVMIGVFYVLVAVWCGVAAWLIRHRAIATILQRFGHKLVPFVLIGVGVLILWGGL